MRSASPRVSRRTLPVSTLGGRALSRCSSLPANCASRNGPVRVPAADKVPCSRTAGDRKSTRLNSSHSQISYAVFCLKKKKKKNTHKTRQEEKGTRDEHTT